MNPVSAMIFHIKRIHRNVSQVLSMNQRNLGYIYPNNNREDYPFADNKLATKKLFNSSGISMPVTHNVYGYFYELRNLADDLSHYYDFVIKPAMGSGGGGIIVITGYDSVQKMWKQVDGSLCSIDDLQKHISDIIFGVYSFGLRDEAIVEERIQQHHVINELSPYGLADIRIILSQCEPVLAMIRLATRDSHGTANIHQGAVGVGISLDSGVTRHATQHGVPVIEHPDSGVKLLDNKIPFWDEVISTSKTIAKISPLKYIGADIAISKTGPYLLEINARPGLEIQNANACGMRLNLENKTTQSGMIF